MIEIPTIKIIKPYDKLPFVAEMDDCIDQLNELKSDYDFYKLVVFMNSDNKKNFFHKKKILEDVIYNEFSENCICTIIPQAPYEDLDLTMELRIFDNKNDNFSIFDVNDHRLMVFENDFEIEIQGNILSDYYDNTYENSNFCFGELDKILTYYKLNMDNLVRQWMYIGEINHTNKISDDSINNYQQFNLSRAKYYKNCNWEFGYPSATAIGADFNFTLMEYYASCDLDKKLFPLRNPNQIDAHKYSEKYSILSKQDNNSPKFERGKIIEFKNYYHIFISGTASIIGEDSIGNTIDEQTNITIDNIYKVFSKDNLKSNFIEINQLPKFNYVRAYVKNYQDLDKVYQICKNKFEIDEIICVQADVCREELLVEIEADVIIKK